MTRLLSTTSGLETTLATLNYSSQALHYLLVSSPSTAIRNRLRRVFFGESRGRPASISPKPPLLAFSSLISEARFTLRLLALVSIWSWGSSTYKSPPKDRVLRTVAYLKVVSIFLYQILENLAYLASKGICGNRLVKRYGGIGAWYLWSTRAWFGYILLEFVRLARESVLFQQREEEQKRHRAERMLAGEKTVSETYKEQDEAREQEIRKWRKSLVNNLAWAPLCVHWSLEKGIGIPKSLTGFISLLAGIWGACDTWAATTPA